MTEIGVRELRDHLSRYLGRVREGEELVITDHGRAIVRVLPVGHERTIDRLIAEGVVTPGRQPKGRSARPVVTKGTVSDLVAEQRR